jgi:hypothetical protein
MNAKIELVGEPGAPGREVQAEETQIRLFLRNGLSLLEGIQQVRGDGGAHVWSVNQKRTTPVLQLDAEFGHGNTGWNVGQLRMRDRHTWSEEVV